MTKQVDTEITNLVDSLINLNYLVIFIGAGASMEGKRDDSPFPGFSQIVTEVLQSAGYTVQPNEAMQDDSLKTFINHIQQQDKPSSYLRTYLDGTPGAPHYQLAALVKTLIDDFSIKIIFLTTNYDELIEKSLEGMGVNPEILSLPLEPKNDKLFGIANDALENRRPVIMHLLGDLNAVSPTFYQNDMGRHISPVIKKNLAEWVKNRLLVIGYSFQDLCISELIFSAESDQNKPVHIVSPEINIRPFSAKQRKMFKSKKNFGEFMVSLLTVLYDRPSVSSNNSYTKMQASYEKQLKGAPVQEVYNFDFFDWRTKQINDFAVKRLGTKIISNKSIDFSDLYHDREIIDWNCFLSAQANIAAILGNAGMGKTSYLYMTASNAASKLTFKNGFIPLLLLPETLRQGIKYRLAEIFLCKKEKIESLLNHFNQLLHKKGKYLLILVDAINEIGEIQGRYVKAEIEELLNGKCWSHIKLVFTCRSYYWNFFLSPHEQHSEDEYYKNGAFTIEQFNHQDVKMVFENYKKQYKLDGSWEGLSDDVREKLRDPLMLRLLAEAYKEDKIPQYAPAVRVFHRYVVGLKDAKPQGNIPQLLKEIGRYYWNADEIVGSMSIPEVELKRTLFGIFEKTALNILYDSNVMVEEDSFIQFTYERFYEFVLGIALIDEKSWSKNIYSAESIYKIWLQCQDQPYSFFFGLKSALIDLSIKKEKTVYKNPQPEQNMLADGKRLEQLLNIKKICRVDDVTAANFRAFILEVLRELLAEKESDEGYKLLQEQLGRSEFDDIVLKIGRDDSKSLPYQVNLLLKNDILIRQEVSFNLLSLIRDKSGCIYLETLIQDNLHPFLSNEIEGLLYLLPVYFQNQKILEKKPIQSISNLLGKLLSTWDEQQQIVFTKNLGDAIYNASSKEGTMFFGGGDKYDGMGYIWLMQDEEKFYAEVLAGLFLNVPHKLSKQNMEVIRFFGSEIILWKNRNLDFVENHKELRMRRWEYFMARWFVVMYAKKRGFDAVLELMQYCIETNLWLSIDFVLCSMENILCSVFSENKEIYKIGVNKMREWVDKTELEYNDFFYQRLQAPDPLTILFNPLSQTTCTEAFLNPTSNLYFLDERIKSGDEKKAKMALLSLRKVARYYPEAGKESLKVAWKRREQYDDEYRNWLYTAIKELRYLCPKIISSLLNGVNANSEERNKIEQIEATVRSNEYNINPFFKWLSEDEKARDITIEWYYKMLGSRSYKDFCKEIAKALVS